MRYVLSGEVGCKKNCNKLKVGDGIHGLFPSLVKHLGVYLRGGYLRVAKQFRHGEQVGTVAEGQRGERVTRYVERVPLAL